MFNLLLSDGVSTQYDLLSIRRLLSNGVVTFSCWLVSDGYVTRQAFESKTFALTRPVDFPIYRTNFFFIAIKSLCCWLYVLLSKIVESSKLTENEDAFGRGQSSSILSSRTVPKLSSVATSTDSFLNLTLFILVELLDILALSYSNLEARR